MKKFPLYENMGRLWSCVIIDQLYRSGVNHFYLSPGLRNAPLMAALEAHPHCQVHLGIDERSSAYRALGQAKRSGEASALICTSGTALLNYMPAMAEASKSSTPLIIISADRPPELSCSDANQTLKQNSVLTPFVREELNMGVPTHEIELGSLARSVVALAQRSKSPQPGPVHLNCPFREPLDGTPQSDLQGQEALKNLEMQWWHLSKNHGPATTYLETIDEPQLKDPRGWPHLLPQENNLIVVGELRSTEQTSQIRDFLHRSPCPYILDVTSSLKYDYSLKEGNTPTFDHPEVYKAFLNRPPHKIIHLGGRMTSKFYYRYLQECPHIKVIHVGRSHKHEDPAGRVNTRLPWNVESYCRSAILYAENEKHKTGFYHWDKFIQKKRDAIEKSALGENDLNFPLLSKHVVELAPPKSLLYLGNSTIIRAFDNYASPENKKSLLTQVHRGASGIEGFISASVGACDATDRPITLLLGDLSFLHDLNALMLLNDYKKRPSPLCIIVANNKGGGIFNLLPLKDGDKILPYMTTPHEQMLSPLVREMGVKSTQCTSIKDFDEAYTAITKDQGVHVIEALIDDKYNSEIYKKLKTIKL